ncbi:uncharacterized protein LOC111386690 [Olea europaea var. sylvestris]|uniref:uncharacterized protein LOC111386690 n=1 Tax=Olea europaea var. sylvestris TaxID=158386 RepID=UPI000C1D4DF4|nr:uncharacterized protein LOC111386690 [Olea europaea var. sylvestris]
MPTEDAGKRSFIARPLSATKKGSHSNKKQDTASSGSITKEQVTSPDKTDTLQVEIAQDEQESSVTDAKYEETMHELGPEILAVEDKKPISITRQAEPENIPDEDVVTIESYTVPEQPDVSLEVEMKELPEDEPKIETTTGNQQELEEDIVNENNHTESDEILADNSKAEIEDMGGAKALDGSGSIDSEEQEMKVVVEEVKLETDNEELKQEDNEKKRDSLVSNDVIEETASLLREQRKNKVKALAGAFETVISLQEPNHIYQVERKYHVIIGLSYNFMFLTYGSVKLQILCSQKTEDSLHLDVITKT